MLRAVLPTLPVRLMAAGTPHAGYTAPCRTAPYYSVGVRRRSAFYLPSFRTRSHGLLAPLMSHPSALQARHAPTSTAALRVHPRLYRSPSPHFTLPDYLPDRALPVLSPLRDGLTLSGGVALPGEGQPCEPWPISSVCIPQNAPSRAGRC